MLQAMPFFLQQLASSITQNTFIKATLGNKRLKSAELKNVFIKPVLIKNVVKICFVYRYPTKDVTKNLEVEESCALIEKMLLHEFYNADLFTAENDFHYLNKNDGDAKVVTRPASLQMQEHSNKHDRQKVRIIKTVNAIYLRELGVTTAEGLVKKDMQDKYKQLNRYIEIVEGIIKDLHFTEQVKVVDMGSGKGYLTFALYDYLVNTLQLPATITGIELRKELVDKCNSIATMAGYGNLHFKAGTIQDAVLPGTDLLIALHACDTATDEAIFSGIKAGAKVIICAPCCHKQVRKKMHPGNEIRSITKHGILFERQAEIITDAIRALLLEAHGYTTRVFDFIATEHTPKNVLIVGIKTGNSNLASQEYIDKATALKSLFGIEAHYLETLLELL